MRHYLLICLLVIFTSTIVYSQSLSEKFVLSFNRPLNKDSIIVSSNELYNKMEMTRFEALNFVYDNDTSKLYCHGFFYDMLNEKKTGKWTELKLPKKCFRMENNSINLLAYSSYDCQESNVINVCLNLVILNKKFIETDKLIVYKGNDNGYVINSLINKRTFKVFLYTYNSKTKMKEFSVYKINSNTLRFELIKTAQIEKISTDNLVKAINKLELSGLFFE